MTEYKQRAMIVPAVFQQLAQGLCAAAAQGGAGAGMFTTALSADGNEPATHYISSGRIEDVFADLLPLTTVTPAEVEGDPAVVSTQAGKVEEVEAIAAQAGITLPAGTIAALFAAIDVSDQEPFVAMARVGLELVQEPMGELP